MALLFLAASLLFHVRLVRQSLPLAALTLVPLAHAEPTEFAMLQQQYEKLFADRVTGIYDAAVVGCGPAWHSAHVILTK